MVRNPSSDYHSYIVYMLQNNQSRQLSYPFYEKLLKLVEASSDSDALTWNGEGSGVIFIDEVALEDILMELYRFHIHTFRKMLMMYGFRKLMGQAGEEYVHPDLSNRKLVRRNREYAMEKDPQRQ